MREEQPGHTFVLHLEEGEVTWFDRFGADSFDYAAGVAVDGEELVIAGHSATDMGEPLGDGDGFARKYLGPWNISP